jgi:hypothetical protein
MPEPEARTSRQYYDERTLHGAMRDQRLMSWLLGGAGRGKDAAATWAANDAPWNNSDTTQAVLGTMALPAKAATGLLSAFGGEIDAARKGSDEAWATQDMSKTAPVNTLALDIGAIGAGVPGPAGALRMGGGAAKKINAAADAAEADRSLLERIAASGKNYDAPYSNYTLPVDDVERLMTGTKVRNSKEYMPEKFISPEDMPTDGFLLNLVGDRTNVGLLDTIGGEKLAQPIRLDGGNGYMRNKHTGAWASDENVTKKLSNKVQSADGRPVYGAYNAMAGTGSDFANMTREVAMRNFDPAVLDKKVKKSFDSKFKDAAAFKKLTADFPGIDSPDLNAWLDKSGTRRSAFFDFMDKSEWKKHGFPDVTEARFAIQDPKLRDNVNGVEQMAGQSIAKMDPAGTLQPVSALRSSHGTYPVDLAGEYVGGIEGGLPRSVLFKDWVDARRAKGVAPSGDNRAFQMSTVLQPMNNQWQDNAMKYLESMRRQSLPR